MTTITAFAIAIVFADWDDCQNWAHAHSLHDDARIEMMCETVPRAIAPKTSLRPRARPEEKK